jgi:hypothetical protein
MKNVRRPQRIPIAMVGVEGHTCDDWAFGVTIARVLREEPRGIRFADVRIRRVDVAMASKSPAIRDVITVESSGRRRHVR